VLPARSSELTDETQSWYPDGRSFLVRSRTAQGRRILRRVVPGPDSAAVTEVVHEAYDVDDGDVSPDGTRLAYISEESGEQRIVVAALRPDGRAGDAVPVSRVAGTHPRWADGSTLLWSSPDLQVMGATVSPSLDVSAPQKRFDLSALVNDAHDFVPLPDGSLLVTRKADGEGEIRQFDVVLNYRAELERALRKASGGGR
jgi:Tol biopolymer transport system component